MPTREITAQDLRNIVEKAMARSIEMHRASRDAMEGPSYHKPSGEPTDEEIDEFIVSNALLDLETQEQLVDPGFLGFDAKTARATASWLKTFRRNVRDWAENESWLAADQPWRDWVVERRPVESTLWQPGEAAQPGWLSTSPAALPGVGARGRVAHAITGRSVFVGGMLLVVAPAISARRSPTISSLAPSKQ